MTPDALRLGLVGCGRIAEHGYAPAIRGLETVELAGVADPDRGRCGLIAELGGRRGRRPRMHACAGELIGNGAIDAVVIASPPAEHVPHARLAAAAGLPALVEKPPAPSAAGAQLLAALDPAPWIGFNRRQLLAPGLLDAVPASGPVRLRLELRYRRASWRPLSVRDDVLTDLGPHVVDLALLITGSRSARIRSAELSRARLDAELETERGPVRLRCASDRPHLELAELRDPAGRRLARSRAGGAVAALTTRLPGRAHPLTGSLRAQLAEFARAVRGEPAGLLATAEDGVRAMEVIERLRQSAPDPATVASP